MTGFLLRVTVGLVMFGVWVWVLAGALDHALAEDRVGGEIARARASCAVVWVEHKVVPAGPDEVLARECR